jgi:hypothetical protein
MRTTIALLMLLLGACSASNSGPAACVAAGGRCVIGGNTCPNRGAQDCNPDRNPGGAICCLPCPQGTTSNDAGTLCQ